MLRHEWHESKRPELVLGLSDRVVAIIVVRIGHRVPVVVAVEEVDATVAGVLRQSEAGERIDLLPTDDVPRPSGRCGAFKIGYLQDLRAVDPLRRIHHPQRV